MTIEGCIRQSTENPLPRHTLTLLMGKEQLLGSGVVRRGDSIMVVTEKGEMPIYGFKMDQNLMGLLKQNIEEWYE